MILDVHGHVSAPDGLYAYKANLLSHRGAHGRGGAGLSDDQLRAAVETPNQAFGISHLEHLDAARIDLRLISPRPYTMMHSEEPPKLVQWFIEETNNVIHRDPADAGDPARRDHRRRQRLDQEGPDVLG